MLDLHKWRMKRIANDIKQKDVARAMGISNSYLCQFEKGDVKLSPILVNKYKNYIEEMEAKQ